MKGRWALFLLGLLCLTSCEVINPSEELPAYIKIEQPQIELDSVRQLRTELGIKDIWVYQNGDPLGAYPVPGTVVPYLNVDRTQFRFEGGVFESGLSNFRLPYPFWSLIELDIQQSALDTFTLSPVFQYRPDTEIEIAWEEDFESGFSLSGYGPTADSTRMHITRREFFDGASSGRVRFDADHTFWNVVSTQEFFGLDKSADTWLEIVYKTDIPFQVGVRYWPFTSPIDETIQPAVTVLPNGTDEWNIIYEHLITQIRAAPTEPVYTLWFLANSGGEEGELFISPYSW